MGHREVGIVILAAGLGTRMQSSKAKVLHEIKHKPMIHYVLQTAIQVAAKEVVVVVGHQAEAVKAACRAVGNVTYAVQKEQLGTGHATHCALAALSARIDCVVILCGDIPLLRVSTLKTLIDDHRQHERDLSLLAVELPDPSGYGRVQMDRDRRLRRIVEEADATPAQKAIQLINAGIYCVSKPFLNTSLNQITADNAQGEYYLTDIVGIGYQTGKSMGVVVGEDVEEVAGVNTLKDLAHVQDMMHQRETTIA